MKYRKLFKTLSKNAQTGMTLVEIMIVVVIMGLIAAGVAFAVIPQLKKAQIEQTRTDLRTMHQAVQLYMSQNQGRCPSTVNDLVQDGQISSATRTKDAWDHDFMIRCEQSTEPVIISAGPDGQENTADDISTAPEAEAP